MTVELQLPPGFRFHPTDEELVMHYLCRKCTSQPISVPIIAEIDLYKYNPWNLPGIFTVFGDKKNNFGDKKLDDWVLCRIYNKKGTIEKQQDSSLKLSDPYEAEEQKPIIPAQIPVSSPAAFSDMAYLDTTDSVPRLHTDSSCSEQVVSPCEREVQSEPKLNEWEKAALDFPFNYLDGSMDLTPNLQGGYQMSPLQDMFMYMQKPF
ncbi:hypothetical protein RJ639_018804 [Escallonia herrerae]|uniref:NAC domain-containing protein n=1 Tax=Escallonia herrerae TaxID=1293975 RepID=A0AA88V9I9_9ASTE|nr:hypothetical protein RJ639_018804 [Escallonia herrerae]